MNSRKPRQDSLGIGLGIRGVAGLDSVGAAGGGMDTRSVTSSQHQVQDSLGSSFSTSSLATPPNTQPLGGVSPSSSAVALPSVFGGTSFHSTNSRILSNRSFAAQPTWRAEEIWDVDPDKLDDDEVEILGALLPVKAANEWENLDQGGGGGTTSVASKSIHTITDTRPHPPIPASHILSQTTSVPSTSTSTRIVPPRSSLRNHSSFASLANLDRPLPPLPAQFNPSPPPFSAFSFNSTPPLLQSAPDVSPSQLLDERVELSPFVERRRSVGGGGSADFGLASAMGEKSTGRKKLLPREAIVNLSEGKSIKILTARKLEVERSKSRSKSSIRGAHGENEEEEEEELGEDFDEFAVAFLQTPPATPPESAMTNRSITRRTQQQQQNPFFPVISHPVASSPSRPGSIYSYSTGSLHSPPPDLPPSIPLPAVPVLAASTWHSRQSSGGSHSVLSNKTSNSSVPTSPNSRHSVKF